MEQTWQEYVMEFLQALHGNSTGDVEGGTQEVQMVLTTVMHPKHLGRIRNHRSYHRRLEHRLLLKLLRRGLGLLWQKKVSSMYLQSGYSNNAIVRTSNHRLIHRA